MCLCTVHVPLFKTSLYICSYYKGEYRITCKIDTSRPLAQLTYNPVDQLDRGEGVEAFKMLRNLQPTLHGTVSVFLTALR